MNGADCVARAGYRPVPVPESVDAPESGDPGCVLAGACLFVLVGPVPVELDPEPVVPDEPPPVAGVLRELF